MRIMLFVMTLVLSGVAFAAGPAYELNPGDSVLVSVWREDALQKEVRVLPDGSITFPLAGRVEVGGMNVTDAAAAVAVKLKDYLPDPNVTMVITSIEGNHAYVLGKVMKPGPVVMTRPVTVLQALSLAGGLDKFADEDAIKVVRRKGAEQEILPVNYRDLIAGRNMATNLPLQAGDTLLVP